MKKIFILFVVCFLSVYPFFILAEDRVEINTASLKQLDKITGVGPVLAQRIVDARPFSSVDDLLRVKGIGEKTLQKIKDQGLAYVEGQSSQYNAENNQVQIQSNQSPVPDGPTPAPDLGTETSLVTDATYFDGVSINEILPSPEGADEINEFIELYNTNNFEIDLSGWKIEDFEGLITTHTLPKDTKISASGYLIFKRPETKIGLNNNKDGLNLIWPNGKVISYVSYDKAPKNQSYNKIGSDWQWSTILTPGSKNAATAYVIKKEVEMLSKQKKPDNSIATASVKDAIGPTENSYATNPWFLLLISLFTIIISGGIILFIKFSRSNKKVI